ncbi:hypothetical protein GW916_09240 [bacterium]|uniref:Mannosyl-glycoprotein endo-beta-N-acetylglucosamidase-like domain-containing protein n=1 Tax=Candidatus Collierbacteria bacterium CG17_big_fil_post_rev_8_21_14_2_50_45_7 TaxID=1974536 RepID=A0A2M7FLH2_9BACT|nr:hypothetical protein [bacterium]PIW06865.1 MAG: hypothetical protein COW38_04020 [Candidatus Collierbacteria bacterium CG17_big_fil_post_rev_8_21_14_2_50_45_7]
MKSLLKVVLWFPITVLTLVFTITTYSKLTQTRGIHGLIRQEMTGFKNQPITFATLPKITFEIKTALAKEDARPLVINKYLTRYDSPMAGMGDYIVKVSDRFDLDPYIVVAIAQQESNLGKLMPPNCHNAWGWGIHSEGTLCFDSWNEGINTFVSGLAEKYLAYGLRTPEEIMTKYNATSPGGAWAKGVNQFLKDLQMGTL